MDQSLFNIMNRNVQEDDSFVVFLVVIAFRLLGLFILQPFCLDLHCQFVDRCCGVGFSSVLVSIVERVERAENGFVQALGFEHDVIVKGEGCGRRGGGGCVSDGHGISSIENEREKNKREKNKREKNEREKMKNLK